MRVYAGVYAMRGCMCRRVGAGVQVLCGYVCVQVWYAMQICANGQYTMQICTNGQVCAMQQAGLQNGRAMHDFGQKWAD